MSMNPYELDELDLREEDKKEIISILKKEISNNPSIISKITKDFDDKEDKMIQFKKIIN